MFQGGPAGIGTVVDIVYASRVDLPAVVAYGACANLDNGFEVFFNPRFDLPTDVYVYYNGWFGSTLLEGAH